MRGALTEEIQDIAKRMIKREITIRELRLIPYIQFVMVNDQKLEPNKISQEEREILRKWKDAGFVEGGATGLSITKEFWDFMCEVLFEGYVKGAFE